MTEQQELPTAELVDLAAVHIAGMCSDVRHDEPTRLGDWTEATCPLCRVHYCVRVLGWGPGVPVHKPGGALG